MAFCGVKNEHLDWVMGMTYALMRESKSIGEIIKEIAIELPLDKPSIAATLLSKIPSFSQTLMSEDTDLGDEYGPKFMEIQQLKKRFEGDNGYNEVIDFINSLELSDKVDAALDAIEEEEIEAPAPTSFLDELEVLTPNPNEKSKKAIIFKKNGETYRAEITNPLLAGDRDFFITNLKIFKQGEFVDTQMPTGDFVRSLLDTFEGLKNRPVQQNKEVEEKVVEKSTKAKTKVKKVEPTVYSNPEKITTSLDEVEVLPTKFPYELERKRFVFDIPNKNEQSSVTYRATITKNVGAEEFTLDSLETSPSEGSEWSLLNKEDFREPVVTQEAIDFIESIEIAALETYSRLENGDILSQRFVEKPSQTIIKKINPRAGKPNRLKIIQRALALDAFTPEVEVAQYFLRGGKIDSSAIDELYRNARGEKRIKGSLISNKSDSPTITELAHMLWENSKIRDNEGDSVYSDQDYRNIIEDFLSSYNNRSEIAEDILRGYEKNQEEQIPEEAYLYLYPDSYIENSIQERELFEQSLKDETTVNVEIGHGIVLENKIETEDEKSKQNQEIEGSEKGAGKQNGQRVIQDFGKSIRPTFRNAVPNRLEKELTEHQKVGVNAIVQAVQTGNSFLLADGAGAGKTRVLLTAAQALKNSGKRVIIVTENKEIISGSFKADSKALGMPFSQDKSENGKADGIGIVTVSNFRDKVNSSEYDVVIIDESQNASGLTSQISEKVKNFPGQIVYASATPFDTEEKTIYILPRLFGISEKEYLDMIGGQMYQRPRRGTELVFPNGKAKFIKVLNSTHERLISEGKMLHRRYEFFGDDNLNIDTIGTADEFGGGYSIEQLEEAVSNFYREKSKRVQLTEVDIKAGATVESKRREINEMKSNALKRIPETFKANVQFLNQIEEDLKQGKQVIVYGVNVKEEGLSFDLLGDDGEVKKVVRPAFLKQMEQKLKARGIEFGVVTGQTKNRSKTVDSFQKGDLKVLLINESGTTGINLNDTVGNAPRRLYISGALPNAIQLEQIKGRVSRLNNASAAEVVYVSVNSEVESRNRNKLMGKMAILNSVLKGDQLESIVEAENNIKEIQKEVEANPKAPFIEDDADGRNFIVKNSFAVKDTLKQMGGSYRKWFGGWKFPMERKEEVSAELNKLLPNAIKAEVQINKVQNEILSEETKDKSVTLPSTLSYGSPRNFNKINGEWKELLGDSFVSVDEVTQRQAEAAFTNKPAPKLSAQEEQFRVDPKVQEKLRGLIRPSSENIQKANDEESTPCE